MIRQARSTAPPYWSRPRFLALVTAFVPVALLILASGLAAQGTDENREGALFDRVDVELVNVEVVVTDRDGNPVRGLAQGDFQVIDGGRAATITHFAALGDATSGITAARPMDSSAPASIASTPRLVTVFVDDSSLPPAGRKRAFDSLRQRLQTFQDAGDRIALVSWDGSLRVRRGLAAEESIEQAISKLEREAPGGLQAFAERRELLREIEAASLPPSASASAGLGFERQDYSAMESLAVYDAVRIYMERRFHDAMSTLDALDRFVTSLAGLEGAKTILLLTGGIAVHPGEEMIEALERKYAAYSELQRANRLDATAFDTSRKQREVAERANAAGVVLHGFVVDASGTPAEERGGALQTADLDAQRRFTGFAGIDQLARATGGLALSEPASAATWIRRVDEERSGTYSLGWVAPEGSPTQTARPLEIKVDRPGLRVRHRAVVRPLTREARARAATLSALMLGEVVGTTRLEIGVGAASPAEKQGAPRGAQDTDVQVEIEVRFALADIVLLPGERFHEGRVRLWIGSQDENGRRSDLTRVDVPLRIANEEILTAQGRTAAWRTTLRLRPVAHAIAVGLDDELGSTLTTARAEFRPGATASLAAAPDAAPR